FGTPRPQRIVGGNKIARVHERMQPRARYRIRDGATHATGEARLEAHAATRRLRVTRTPDEIVAVAGDFLVAQFHAEERDHLISDVLMVRPCTDGQGAEVALDID